MSSGTIVATRAQRDADTRRCERGVLVEHERLAQFVLNSLRDAHCVSRVSHAAQKNRKLIATETRERVDRTQGALETFGKCDQQQVAMRVAEAVVDVLETIEIEEEHGKHVIVPPVRALDLGLE